VVPDVAGAAEPSDVEGLVVVVVVPVCDRIATYLARLTIWEGSAGCESCEDSPPVLGVVGVALSAVGFDPLGVALVDGESIGLAVSWNPEIAASLGAESAVSLGRDEGDSAVLALLAEGHGSLSSRAI